MTEPAPRKWTVEEFFAWQERQAERYELVEGFPVRLMADAKNVHDDIVVNVLADLRNQLRGSGCRPFTGDGSVETRPGQIRRPDVGVDCGHRNPDAMAAALPRLVVEVLSPTTRDFDTFGKLEEYKSVDSLDGILVVEPNAPEAVFWFSGRNMNRYIAIVRADDSPGYSVSLPDFPGFVSGGATFEEAFERAAQGLRFHIEGMSEDGETIPEPTPLAALRVDPEFAEVFEDAIVALVPLLPPRTAWERVNISVEKGLLAEVDRAAEARGLTRSGFLAEAARRALLAST